MAWGLPKLPGLTFSDPTKTQFHMNPSLKLRSGHRFPDMEVHGPGIGVGTDVDSNAFAAPEESCQYDPSLTYGRVKQPALPQVVPHFVTYDKRCLKFVAFFKQPVYDSPDEQYRVRVVNIIYFLEDDTMLVSEPAVRNSGIWQGKLVKRDRIPKNTLGEYWHWKDLDVGKDICIHGRVFHTVSCDLYTREWLESQGIELSKEEALPEDPYTKKQSWKNKPVPRINTGKDDKLRRFLEYDGKVLTFDVVWDDRDSPYGELGKYKMFYFLQDDTISIKEEKSQMMGKDPFPMLLKKIKLPKQWKAKPVTFPGIVMETTEAEVTTYYVPKDLIVGETIFVLSRRFLIYDCDAFTRRYFESMLGIKQPPAIQIPEKPRKEIPKSWPPHIGIGSPEDSLQSCFGLLPKEPYKDIIRYNLNAGKNLRYLCELENIHPEDKGRQFVLFFSLADSCIRIEEIARRNSGRREGRFLKSMKLQLPDSDPNFPTYYTPDKFYIGAVIPVFKHRFRITGCDLYVYRYMCANPEKFPPEVIDNARNYHMREGNLKAELQGAMKETQDTELRKRLLEIGKTAVAEPTNMEKCMQELEVVEGSAVPLRPPTPPQDTTTISYDDTLRLARPSAAVCEDVQPLKGILKSATEGRSPKDEQKVVCFSGPQVAHQGAPKQAEEISYQGPRYDDSPDFCDKYKDPGHEERAGIRERHECQYEIVPPRRKEGEGSGFEPDPDAKKQKYPGYLGSFEVDCKETPEHMRLAPDAYEKVKKLRQDVPTISPAATRVMDYPRAPYPAVDTCMKPDKPPGESYVCPKRKEEDVVFSCPHVEPILPCCPEDARACADKDREFRQKEEAKEAARIAQKESTKL